VHIELRPNANNNYHNNDNNILTGADRATPRVELEGGRHSEIAPRVFTIALATPVTMQGGGGGGGGGGWRTV